MNAAHKLLIFFLFLLKECVCARTIVMRQNRELTLAHDNDDLTMKNMAIREKKTAERMLNVSNCRKKMKKKHRNRVIKIGNCVGMQSLHS